MKRYTLIQSAFAAAALLMASCSNQDEINLPHDNRAVSITTTLDHMQTRAESTSSPYTGTDLSLSIAKESELLYTNVRWNRDSTGTWTPETSMLWKDKTTSYQIYGYAPYKALRPGFGITQVDFSVETDQTKGLTTSDLVGCVITDHKPGDKNDPVSLVFTHKLAKLTVQCTFKSEFDTPVIKNITLMGANTKVLYNAIEDTITTPSEVQPVKMHPTTATTATAYDCIVVPQTIASGTKMLKVELEGGRVFYYTVPADTVHTFATATAYTLPLVIGKDRIEVGEVTVAPWGEESEMPGGEAKPINVPININTRAAGDGNAFFVAGDEVKILALEDTTAYTPFTLRESGEWLNANNGQQIMATQLGTLMAVYPSNAIANGYRVPSDQTTPEKLRAADYMTSDPLKLDAPPTESISFTLKHRMSKVIINIAGYTGFEEGHLPTLSDELISINYFRGYILGSPYKTSDDQTGLHQYEAMVKPAELREGYSFFSLKVDGANSEVKMPKAVKFEPGKQYTFKLTVKKMDKQTALDFVSGGVYDRDTTPKQSQKQ